MGTRLPLKLYRVVATGGNRHYWENASQTFTALKHAEAKIEQFRARGAEMKMYEGDVVWREVDC
jgi:hypothetical protein